MNKDYMCLKNILLVIGVLLSIVMASSQTSVFYNKGSLSIVDTDTTRTRLYIGKDIVVASDTTGYAVTSSIYVKNAKVLLTGNFRNNVLNGTAFTNPASEVGLFEFRSDSFQKITTDGIDYQSIPSKSNSYIDFPNIRINNNKHVNVSPEIGMKTRNIDLSKGWLILNSRKAEAIDYPTIGPDMENRTITAHLFADGSVNYQNWSATDVNDRGFIEVNMRLDDANHIIPNGRSLVGFGTPFQSIKADYFMWNFLMAPTNNSFLGDTGSTIPDPNFVLQAGVGYVLGVDLRGTDESLYSDVHHDLQGIIKFDERVTDSLYFNRFRFSTDNNRNSNQLFGTDGSQPAYQNERLNTENVIVNLRAGYNYLANPFMTPLDLSDLLGSNTAGGWNIISDNSANTNRDLVNRVWILKGDAAAQPIAPGSTWIRFVYNYYLAKSIGGTYTDEESNVTIAPLQMFVVYATKAGQITIPKSKRTTGRTQFIRNTRQPRKDDFIIEVIDQKTQTTDRASVVLRTAQEIETNRECENVKRTATVSTEGGNQRSTKATEPVEQSTVSQLYTMDVSGTTPYTVQFYPLGTTKTAVLYMTPSLESQNIILRGLRLTTMSEISEIWLEDRIYNTKVLLNPETLYETSSRPTDRRDRFVLHFNTSTEVGIDGENVDSDITLYYLNDVLTLSGFDSDDFGSNISVYDMQGRLVKSTQVTDHRVVINLRLSSGSYIVKVSGNRSYAAKFLAY